MWGDIGAGFGYLGIHGPVSDVPVSLEIARFGWDSVHKHFVSGEAKLMEFTLHSDGVKTELSRAPATEAPGTALVPAFPWKDVNHREEVSN